MFANKYLVFGFAVLLVLVAPIIGCVGGYWLYGRDVDSARIWRSLGKPPAPIARLVDAEFDTVYVQTVQGDIFSCYRASQYDIDCWTKVTFVPQVSRGPCALDHPTLAPPPPLPPVEVLDINYCHRFGRSEFKYILLADGTVMQWIYDDFHWTLPPQQAQRFNRKVFAGTCLGLAGGLAGAGLMLWKWRQHRSHPRPIDRER
jgi:hypothetical protein